MGSETSSQSSASMDSEDYVSGVVSAPYGEEGPTRYENAFHRVKLMQSEIIVERGITRRLATVGRDIIPEWCHESKNYLLTDTIVDELYGDRVLEGLREAGLQV